ncbi:YkgJ family cysteine cluster protein [Candidatus Woesearchaeota archaeon]|nr:YkgJ family cysteine cluster protein [Candidatus Woesearchaeota archaeon]
MPIVSIDKNTRWECQHSGKCCNDLIISKQKLLSIEVDGRLRCKHFDPDTRLCGIYNDNRPFLCKIYPFVPDLDAILGSDGTAYPRRAFTLDNLGIHTECPGYGKGPRVYGNKRLLKRIDELSLEFALRFKEAHEKKIPVEDIY